MQKLPNFFLAGAPKAGTTSLYRYLDQHPEIFMSPIKEPNFFAAEVREELCVPQLRQRMARERGSLPEFLSGDLREKRFGAIVTEWTDYLRLFANAETELAVGEASVCYLWSPSAPERIAEKIPKARILVMLRDPVERAFSQYLHGLGTGDVRGTFREQIDLNLSAQRGLICSYYPFLEFGLYSAQLESYRGLFAKNIWIGFYEDFKSRPVEVFRSICAFLGVDTGFTPDMTQRHLESEAPKVAAVSWLKRSGLWQTAARMTPKSVRPYIRRGLTKRPGAMQMDRADRDFLAGYYREDVRKLECLLNRDLSHWLSSAKSEPVATVPEFRQGL